MALSNGPSFAISWTPNSPSGKNSCATNSQTNIVSPPRIPAIVTRFAMAPPSFRSLRPSVQLMSPLISFHGPRNPARLLFTFKVPQALQHSAGNQRQRHGRIIENLRELAALFRRDEFPPRNCFRVRTATQPSPAHGLGADAQAVVVAFKRQLLVAAPREQLRVYAKLLRPVARNTPANRKNAHALGCQHGIRKFLEVFERIEA